MAVAHAREPAISELAEHIPKMHLAALVSNLDGGESLVFPTKNHGETHLRHHDSTGRVANAELGLTGTSANPAAAPCHRMRFAAI
jgi:hypothetical protein